MVIQKKEKIAMPSFHGEGKGEGSWVIWKRERYWLSALSPEEFKDRKENVANPKKAIYYLEKDGKDFTATLDQLELAEPQ